MGSQIQDTLSSAVDKAGLSWPTVGRPVAMSPLSLPSPACTTLSLETMILPLSFLSCMLPFAVRSGKAVNGDTHQCLQLGTLLLLAVLTSALTSRLLQPDLTKQKTSALRSSMEQADQRYSSFLKKLQAAEDR